MLSLSDLLCTDETVVVHCNTEDEAVAFIQLAHDEVGFNRTSLSAKIAWRKYDSRLCFRLTDGLNEIDYGFADIELYKMCGHTIYEASSFLRTVPESNIEPLVAEDVSIEGLF